MMRLTVEARQESWPLREPFVISRFSQTDTVGLYVRVSNGAHCGHGESEPHESDMAVALQAAEQVGACDRLLSAQCTAEELRERVPLAGARGGWTLGQLLEYAPSLADLGVRLIEQPLAAGLDAALQEFRSPVPLSADESCLDRGSLDLVERCYDFINTKLDETGGLTEALLLAREAQRRGLGLMTGCNVGTSLAMAPAFLVGQLCQFLDLDGPLMLRADREPRMSYDAHSGWVQPPGAQLWG